MMKNSIIFLTVISFLIVCGCNNNTEAPNTTDKYIIPDSLLKTLKIDTVVSCPLVNSLTLTGKVAFNDEQVAKIFPLVSGNIMDVNVQLGDYVKRGQQLGIIRSGEMAGYANDLVSARTNLAVAKKNLDAAEDMYKSGLLSEKDYLNTKALYQQAQGQLTRAGHVIQINGGNTQSLYIVKAPIDGFIVEKNITNNMSIRTDNTNALFTVSDLKNIWILANVYESQIAQVHLGDEVEVTTLTYPGKKFRGKVDKILNVLDPANKVMKIRVVLPNPDYLLKPEMYASVTVVSKTDKDALCIPSSALIFDHSQNYILVYKSPSDVKIVPVQLLSTHGDRTYISGNLSEGDKLINSNVLLIYDALNS